MGQSPLGTAKGKLRRMTLIFKVDMMTRAKQEEIRVGNLWMGLKTKKKKDDGAEIISQAN